MLRYYGVNPLEELSRYFPQYINIIVHGLTPRALFHILSLIEKYAGNHIPSVIFCTDNQILKKIAQGNTNLSCF